MHHQQESWFWSIPRFIHPKEWYHGAPIVLPNDTALSVRNVIVISHNMKHIMLDEVLHFYIFWQKQEHSHLHNKCV